MFGNRRILPIGLFKSVIVGALITLIVMATVLQTYTTHNFLSYSLDLKSGLESAGSVETEMDPAHILALLDKINTGNETSPTFTSGQENDILAAQKTELKPKVFHIGFLKVHKAGSTTMQNLFFRFGIKHNLTFVLPIKGHYFLSSKVAMPVRKGSHSDILACHSVYSRKLFGDVLPPDTVNIGIIRKPLDRMISAAYYYRDVWHSPQLSKVPKKNFIHELVQHPELYEPVPFSKTKNAMGCDFGFMKNTTINSTTYIERHLAMLKEDFKLVLVMERFDESLILMRRVLHWDIADVLYLKSNSHDHKPVLLTPEEITKFKRTCFLDYIVYDTFVKIFDDKVKEAGSGLQKEVKYFQSVLPSVKEFCDTYDKNGHGAELRIDASQWNNAFSVTGADCKIMKTPELSLVRQLKERHAEMHYT